MINIIFGLVIFFWIIGNIIITLGMIAYSCSFTSNAYLTIKNKELWRILFQYGILLPHMIFAWICKLLKCVPIKNKSK